MKRMIWVWSVLLGIVLTASILQPGWSINTNPWTLTAMILLVFSLLNEFGLMYYRRRTRDIREFTQHSRQQRSHHEQEDHYIPNHENRS